MRQYNIGITHSTFIRMKAEALQRQLAKAGFEAQLVDLQAPYPEDQQHSKEMDMAQALHMDRIDISVEPLALLPVHQPDGICMAGLSDRKDPSDLLLLRADRNTDSRLLGLPEQASIGVVSNRQFQLVKHLMPETVPVILDTDISKAVRDPETTGCDAFIADHWTVARMEKGLSGYKSTALNPMEFIPAPGQGILAYRSRTEDFAARQALREIHNRSVARCSNIERGVLSILGDEHAQGLGVYCTQDPSGNYHVYAVLAGREESRLKRSLISRSTNFELAETVVEELTKPV